MSVKMIFHKKFSFAVMNFWPWNKHLILAYERELPFILSDLSQSCAGTFQSHFDVYVQINHTLQSFLQKCTNFILYTIFFTFYSISDCVNR